MALVTQLCQGPGAPASASNSFISGPSLPIQTPAKYTLYGFSTFSTFPPLAAMTTDKTRQDKTDKSNWITSQNLSTIFMFEQQHACTMT